MYYPVFLCFYIHFMFLLLPRQYFVEQIGKRYHRIFCLRQCICLRPHLDQHGLGAHMHIITIALQKDRSGIPGNILPPLTASGTISPDYLQYKDYKDIRYRLFSSCGSIH